METSFQGMMLLHLAGTLRPQMCSPCLRTGVYDVPKSIHLPDLREFSDVRSQPGLLLQTPACGCGRMVHECERVVPDLGRLVMESVPGGIATGVTVLQEDQS